MSNQIAVQQPPFTAAGAKPSALGVMAARFNVEPAKLLSTLKNTVFKNATDDELLALVVVANEYGLNPLTKQIYAFPNKGGGIVPVVAVDGWMRVINEHAQMDGVDFEFDHDAQGSLVACTCVIYRKDRTRPVRVTEYLEECKRNTDPWKMEHRMLRHKALIQCARVAFGLSGIFDEDEAERIKAANNSVENGGSQRKQPFAVAAKQPTNPFPVKVEEETLDMTPVCNVATLIAATPAIESTPQELLSIAISDFGCPEHAFMKTFAKMSPGLVRTAETIRDLSDKAANAALKEIDTILTATEEGK